MTELLIHHKCTPSFDIQILFLLLLPQIKLKYLDIYERLKMNAYTAQSSIRTNDQNIFVTNNGRFYRESLRSKSSISTYLRLRRGNRPAATCLGKCGRKRSEIMRS